LPNILGFQNLPVGGLGESTMTFPSSNGNPYDPPSTPAAGRPFEPELILPAWAQLDRPYDSGFGHVFKPSAAGYDVLLAGRTSGIAPEPDVAFFNYTRLYTSFGGQSETAEFKHLIVTTTAADWRETAAVAAGYAAAQPASRQSELLQGPATTPACGNFEVSFWTISSGFSAPSPRAVCYALKLVPMQIGC